MVSDYILTIEKELCYGCFTCEVACKQEHMLPPGPGLIKIAQKGPERKGGKLRTEYKPVMCMHCEKPPCIEACPENAIIKRSDGVVLIQEEKCNGCRQCLDACPLKAIKFSDEKKMVIKCDLCVKRLDAGKLPSCVHHCPTEAIKLQSMRYRFSTKIENILNKSIRLPVKSI